MNDRCGAVEFRALDLCCLQRFAQQLHRQLPTRVVIGLSGTLGAGKTRLVQEIAAAAGIDTADVTSPTFTLVQHYHGNRLIHHVDAYRLADEDEFIEIGGEELFEDDAVVLIEWPERIRGSLPSNSLMLEIEIDEDRSAESQAANTNSASSPAAQATRTIRASSRDETLMNAMRGVQAALNEHVGGAERVGEAS